MKAALFKIILLIILPLNFAFANSSSWQGDSNQGSKVRLISSKYEKQQLIAIHFKLQNGWKIYGPGSENIGLPPKISFQNSQNIKNYKILWPEAIDQREEIGDEIFNYSIYQKEVIIPIIVETDDAEVTLNLSYGLCSDYCVPANMKLSIKLDGNQDKKILENINKYYPILGSKAQKSSSNLLYIIMIAIIGGAILNIMPCVLPVLSIKLISIINHSNTSTQKIRLAFASTILGIISCFIFFSAIAATIKFGGESFDWGLQFQNTYFLIFIFLTLTFFICNLLGIFEFSFSQTLSSVLNKKISKSSASNVFAPNFLSGILAVLLATPCSAPFLGSAITFALTQNISTIFIIFIAIGVGFSAPYFVLILAPKAVYLLPKPGSWMNNIKKIMASFLIATQVWIIYILMSSIGFTWAIITAIIGTLLIKSITFKNTKAKLLTSAVLVIIAFFVPVNAKNYSHLQVQKEISKDAVWQKFSEEKISKYVKEGKIVVVDITARWCITCKYNKFRVFNDENIIKRLKSDEIVALRGNITTPNEEIMDYLHRNNRFAIPFNIVYGPSAPNGLASKVILTKADLLELIDKAK